MAVRCLVACVCDECYRFFFGIRETSDQREGRFQQHLHSTVVSVSDFNGNELSGFPFSVAFALDHFTLLLLDEVVAIDCRPPVYNTALYVLW
jgi:hypothetical protein